VDVKPLLDLCKIKDTDIIEMTVAAQVLHSFYNGVETIIIFFLNYLDEKLQTILNGIKHYLKWRLESIQETK
jgi:hypothetical protein